jgi:hypothetical protein
LKTEKSFLPASEPLFAMEPQQNNLDEEELEEDTSDVCLEEVATADDVITEEVVDGKIDLLLVKTEDLNEDADELAPVEWLQLVEIEKEQQLVDRDTGEPLLWTELSIGVNRLNWNEILLQVNKRLRTEVVAKELEVILVADPAIMVEVDFTE